MKRTVWTSLCLGAALAVAAMVPQGAWAASVDINGQVVDEGVKIIKGTTMIDQDNLRDVLMLDVNVEKKAFTLTNDDKTVTIKGTVGEKTLLVNDEAISLPAAATFKEERLWLPLRPLMETFGQVDWDSTSGRVRAYFDYTRFNDLPNATEADTTVPYEIPTDSGFGVMTAEEITIDSDPALGVLHEVLQNGAVVGLNNGAGPVVAVAHENYRIATMDVNHNAYYFDEDAFVWQERPIAAPTAEDRAYLYIQPRKESAKAICLDEFVIGDDTYRLTDVNYNDGILIWSVWEQTKQQMTLKLYDVAQGKTRILDEIALASITVPGRYTSDVAVNDTYAAVVLRDSTNDVGDAGMLYRYTLKDGERKAIGRGYHMSLPQLYGDNLVVVAMSGNQEVKPVTGNDWEVVPNALWCYNLKEDAWRYQVPARLAGLPDGAYQHAEAVILDDNHLAFNLNGVNAAYDLRILDVEKGTYAIAKDSNNRTLRFGGNDVTENVLADNEWIVRDIRPCKGDNVARLITFGLANGNVQYVIYPVDFNW